MAAGKPTENMGETSLMFMVHPTLMEENMQSVSPFHVWVLSADFADFTD